MDACTDRAVEFVILMFPVQMGKTEVLLNFLGYVIDQDPGPTLVVYPTQHDSDKVIRNRIQPLVTYTPALKRHVAGGSDSLGLKELRFNRCIVYPAWSNSPAALASTPCRYVINDEVDKFPPFAGKEASPIKLSEMRTTTFRGRRKILIASTPTTDLGYIYGEFQRTDQRAFWLPCLRCGEFQVLDFFKGLKWPEGSSAASVKESKTAWYECAACKAKLSDNDKASMLQRGVWAPKASIVLKDGTVEGPPAPRFRAGFHINALYSPWLTLSEVAAEFLEAKGDAGRMMNFVNSRLALPWKDKVETIKDAHLKARKRDYKAGTAPTGAIRLTGGVDVQGDHFWFVIRAWGEGERSWLVRYGSCPSWKDVEKAMLQSYRIGGNMLQVERVLVDSGHKTDEVYRFCRKHRPVMYPSKGASGVGLAPSKITKPHPGIVLYLFNADFWKDKVARLIQTADGEPGCWSLHKDVDDTYMAQMTAEHRVFVRKMGRTYSTWEKITDNAPNHLWDCEVLNAVAADSIGVRYLEGVEESVQQPQAQQPKVQPPTSGWLERSGEGWMAGGSIWE